MKENPFSSTQKGIKKYNERVQVRFEEEKPRRAMTVSVVSREPNIPKSHNNEATRETLQTD